MTEQSLAEIFLSDESLSLTEVKRLDELEQVVEAGLTVFVQVGNALLEIRDSRLYRQAFPTFEAYCRERWGMVQQSATRMIRAAEVVQNLQSEPIGSLPTTESQARPLTRLEPEVQREVWQDVVDSTPAEQITAKIVEEQAKAAEPLNEAVKVIKEALKPEPAPAQQPIIPEPVKPKDPVIAAVTEKVKAGEMTVMEAAKEIKAATSTGDFHVSQGNNDWYTPAEYIEAARAVMGGIDLDPASSDQANQVVQSSSYFTKETNGLQQEWHGRVWMNPPFSMPLIKQFAEKMADEFESGRVQQAIVITNNGTETQWFHTLLKTSGVFCLLRSRAKFYSPGSDVMAARQGQVIFYFGDQKEKFAEIFNSFGAVAYL